MGRHRVNDEGHLHWFDTNEDNCDNPRKQRKEKIKDILWQMLFASCLFLYGLCVFSMVAYQVIVFEVSFNTKGIWWLLVFDFLFPLYLFCVLYKKICKKIG